MSSGKASIEKSGVAPANGAGYPAELLAFSALKKAAVSVAKNLPQLREKGTKVVMSAHFDCERHAYENAWLLGRIKALDEMLVQLLKELSSTKDEPVAGSETAAFAGTAAAIAASAPKLLGELADTVSFFKNSIEIRNRTFTMAPNALLATMAEELRESTTVIVLDWSAPAKDGPLFRAYGSLLQKRPELQKLRRDKYQKAEDSLSNLKTARAHRSALETELARIEKVASLEKTAEELRQDIKEIQSEINTESIKEHKWEHTSAEIDRALQELEQLFEKLSTRDELGVSLLERAATYDHIIAETDTDTDTGGTYLLSVDIVSQGGEMVVKTHRLWWDTIWYYGGCVVAYALTKPGGQIVSSGTAIGSKAIKRGRPVIGENWYEALAWSNSESSAGTASSDSGRPTAS